MRRPTLILLVPGFVAALLVSVLPAGSASAETKRGTDARGDMQRVTWAGDFVRSGQANGDIIRYRVSYNRQRLKVVLRYRGLNFTDPFLGAGAELQWGSSWAELELEATKTHRRGRSVLASGGDADDSCRVSHRISYRDNRIVLRAPSRCFGAPRILDLLLWTYTTDERDSASSWRADVAPGRDVREGRTIRIRRG